MHRMPKLKPMALALLLASCIDDPETCEPDSDHAYNAGTLWGPCLPDVGCYPGEGECHEKTEAKEVDGEMIDVAVANSCLEDFCTTDHPTCMATEGWVPCVLGCGSDEDCPAGSQCMRVPTPSEYTGNACMWPTGD